MELFILGLAAGALVGSRGKGLVKSVAKAGLTLVDRTREMSASIREDMRDAIEEARYERETELAMREEMTLQDEFSAGGVGAPDEVIILAEVAEPLADQPRTRRGGGRAQSGARAQGGARGQRGAGAGRATSRASEEASAAPKRTTRRSPRATGAKAAGGASRPRGRRAAGRAEGDGGAAQAPEAPGEAAA